MELWNTIVEFLQNSGVIDIATLGTLGTAIAGVITCIKSVKSSTIKSITAISEKQQISKEFKETTNEIAELKNNLNIVSESVNRLSAMLLVVLNNSKISAEAKQQALNIVNATSETTTKIVEKVNSVSEVVSEVIEVVSKNIEKDNQEKTETNPYLSNLDSLINE